MCQVHQIRIIVRYLTRRPKLEASQELLRITLTLTKTDKESFTFWLEEWYEKYRDFLKEHTISPQGKKQYIHRRTRSAYFSLKRNLPYLWTWYDYIDQIDIPYTTNELESTFSHLRDKIRVHR